MANAGNSKGRFSMFDSSVDELECSSADNANANLARASRLHAMLNSTTDAASDHDEHRASARTSARRAKEEVQVPHESTYTITEVGRCQTDAFEL